MKTIQAVLVVVLGIGVSSTSASPVSRSSHVQDPFVYAAALAYLRSSLESQGWRCPRFLVSEAAGLTHSGAYSPADVVAFAAQQQISVDQTAATSLSRVLATRGHIRFRGPLTRGVTRLSVGEAKQIDRYRLESWKELKRRYPTECGLVRFSGIGYSRDGHQAMVYLQWVCGELCGQGMYVVLMRTKDGWTQIWALPDESY